MVGNVNESTPQYSKGYASGYAQATEDMAATVAQRDALLVACEGLLAAFDGALGGAGVSTQLFEGRADAVGQAYDAVEMTKED